MCHLLKTHNRPPAASVLMFTIAPENRREKVGKCDPYLLAILTPELSFESLYELYLVLHVAISYIYSTMTGIDQ